MSNAGLVPGLTQDGWRRFETEMLCAGSGGETQPVLDTQPYPFGNPSGRYLFADQSYVVAAIQTQFAGAGYSVGAGGAYVFRLPRPARRLTGPGTSCPVPLGLGMCYLSFTDPQMTTPVVVTLADPFPSLQGQEDSYVQCYCPTMLSWGTGVLASSTATVTHRLGYTPRAEDIEVVFTDAAGVGAATGADVAIKNITATTFDVTAFGAAGAANFVWKIKGKPPTGATGPLLSPTKPLDWTRTNPGNFVFGNIFLKFCFRPRR